MLKIFLSKKRFDGDGGNILLLLLLYILQGIPLGLSASIPMLLQNRHISYKEQAKFSFVYWPFSLKLLWAPLVDSLFFKSVGRRKTWLIPAQYILGLGMMLLSSHIENLMNDSHVHVDMLTFVFFVLNFLAATQDIAVDGWAITMLKRNNVGYASTCNSVGQTAGYFFGYVLFIALESPDFCNKYLRSEPQTSGLLTLSSFLSFWGVVFMITTTLVWLFKTEKESNEHLIEDEKDHEEVEEERGVKETYKLLWHIIKLPSVKILAVFLLTCKIGFAAADAITGLRLVEEGVPKAHLALLAIPLIPLQIILPFVISKYTSGRMPMKIFMKAFPYRLVMGLEYAMLVWMTPWFKNKDGNFPSYYYMIIVVSYALHQVAVYSMFVSVMAYFARISDPSVGGTYMTLLNTICNLGGNWPTTLALWLVDYFTRKTCSIDGVGSCINTSEIEECARLGGECITLIDGYYIEMLICTIIGVIWLSWGKTVMNQLHHGTDKQWRVKNN
ncbi:acetyl-coenzyme A transporter 1-like [Artemia franciscana]|uniref:Acetyl-coenzyme A transporter 1 n=1 Tax=Artemia franciscana TaxID=6661 RepID=A0AA88I2B1_ARTSF|nr:hypothetical protein QYM36_007132 [Artemia franciscana]